MKTGDAFDISFVFLAYVPPYRKDEKDFIIESEVLKKTSPTTDYLFKIFDSSMTEAKIEIHFNSDEKQNNDIRNQIVSITEKELPSQKSAPARKLAQRLYEETDGRNGTGLFAIIVGQKARTTRVVLMRFKGVDGLVNHKKKFLIDYISEVFTKKNKHYKLAVYEDIVSSKSFWKGYSVDKQITANQYKPISLFWIEGFLDSKTTLTSAQGTLHFSKVLKAMLAKTTNIEEQEEIISGIVNLRTKKNVQMSLSEFCSSYLSPALGERIKVETNNDDFFNSVFPIDNDVYKKEFGRTVLSLIDGITAYIPTFNYEKHVTETLETDGSKSITITGKLSSKKIHVQQAEKEKIQSGPSKRNKQ